VALYQYSEFDDVKANGFIKIEAYFLLYQIFGQGGRSLPIHHIIIRHTYRRSDGKCGIFDSQFCHHCYGVSGQRSHYICKKQNKYII